MWNSSRFFLQGHRLYAGTDTSGWFLGIFYQLQFSESKRPELQPGTSCARHRQLEAFIGQQESSVADGAPCELTRGYAPLKKCYQAWKLGRLDNSEQWIAHIFNRLDLFQTFARPLDYFSSMKSLHAKSATKRADCQYEPQCGCWFCVTMWVSQFVFVSWLCAGSRVSSMTCSFSSVVVTFYSSPSSPDWVVPSHPILPSTPSQWGSPSPPFIQTGFCCHLSSSVSFRDKWVMFSMWAVWKTNCLS